MSMKKVFGYDIDDVLKLAGLERKTTLLGSLLPSMGLLVIGAAVGAGIGLAFAPSSGQRLRQGVGAKLDQLRDRAKGETHRPDTLNAAPH
jgi:hypothetical protein